jgi:hypothetical protein
MDHEMISSNPTPSRRQVFLIAGLLIFLLLLALQLYTFTHEGGHALVGLLFGGTISTFNVNFFNLSAHVGLDGSFSPLQNALISAAGVLLPVVLCMAFLALAPRQGNPILEWFRLLVFMGSVNALLAWIVIPFLVQAGQTVGDDSANFLGYTHLPPVLVSGGALLVYLAGWAFFLSRSGGARALVARLRRQRLDFSLPAVRRTLLSLAGVGVLLGAVILALNLALPDRFLQAPAGYQLAATVDLSQRPLTDESVATLSLAQPARLSFFIALREVKGAPARVHLVGPGGYDNTFFADTDPKLDVGRATVHPTDLPLAPGDYQLRLTFPQSAGQITVYTLTQ